MIEIHPYGEFIPDDARWMIIGSFPIGKFTNPKKRNLIKAHEMDFYFGGERNLLWKILGLCFKRELNTKERVIAFLEEYGIGIGDVIKSCHRKNGGSSDSDLYQIEWNTNLIEVIKQHHIKKIFFTSRKVEVWFNKLFPHTGEIQKVCLISPSGQSVRGLSRHPEFREWERSHLGEPKFNFILGDYCLKFGTIG